MVRRGKIEIKSTTKKIKYKEEHDILDYLVKFIKYVVLTGVIGAFLVLVIGLYYFSENAKGTPSLDPNKLINEEPSVLYDVNGEVLAEVGMEPRIEITVQDLPKQVVEALISIEDSRFWYHKGVDPLRIISSALNNVQGGDMQGGSTLTQQLVKLSFLDPEDQTLGRKVKEAILAWNMEEEYRKDEILGFYINKIYMGNGVYGLETASQYYYGKSLSELTLPQSALLVGIPNAPNDYNPYNSPELAKKRRDIVLYRMLATESITEEEYKQAVETDVMYGVLDEGKQIFKDVDPQYQEYVDQVYRQLLGRGLDLATHEYHIYTYLDTKAQENVNNIIYNESTLGLSRRELDVTVAVVDVNTGGVRALAGGNSKKELGVFDGFSYPVNGKLQVGSTLKPILAYAPALELKGLKMSDTMEDKPYKYSNGYTVQNFDFKYDGKMTLDTALKLSRNTIPLELQNNVVGMDDSYRFAEKMGLNIPQEEWVESGTLSASVSIVDLASSYVPIVNKGLQNPLTYVSKVEDSNGITVYEQDKPYQVLSEENAMDLKKTLYGIVNDEYGFGRNAKVDGYSIIGKTGTTNYGEEEDIEGVPSVSFVGVTPDVSIAVQVQGENRRRGLVGDENKLAVQWYQLFLEATSQDTTPHLLE